MALGLRSFEEYLERVREDKSERTFFIDYVTTNETYFYRTPRVWSYIRETFLPAWLEGHRKETLQAWSAASSSGEETHTLGIVLEDFKARNPGFSYQILGSDISREMVGLCEQGVYSGRSIEAFRKSMPDLFDRYMVPVPESPNSFKVVGEVRNRIRFQEHNLFTTLNLSLIHI